MHHPRQFCSALAGDSLQHVHLCVPLSPALGHHDLLLHANPGGDLEPHGPEQPCVCRFHRLLLPDLFTKAKLSFVARLFFFPVLSRDVHLRRSHNNIPKARMRTLKMSIMIVTSFIVCWTPYYLLGLWYWLFPEKMEETVSHSLTHMLFIFGLFNACLDPITYGLFTIHLHQGLKRCCRTANTTTDLENNTCLVHMTRFSSHRQKASGAYNTDKEEVNDDTHTKICSRPIMPVSKM